MSNKYLEKVANRLKEFQRSKGKDVDGMSSQALQAQLGKSKNAGSFAQLKNTEKKMAQGAPAKKSMFGFLKGTDSQPSKRVNPQAADLKGRIATHNAGVKAVVGQSAQGGAKGYLNKAIGFAKKNPLAAAGGALAAGAVGGAAYGRLSKGRQEQAYPMYG